MFAAMKKLAVREENTMVARVVLHNMKQAGMNLLMFMEPGFEDRQVCVSLRKNVLL